MRFNFLFSSQAKLSDRSLPQQKMPAARALNMLAEAVRFAYVPQAADLT